MSHSYADECPGCGSAEMLEEIARLRANGYRQRGRYRQYSKDGAEFHLGMMGEKAFHIWSGLDMNLEARTAATTSQRRSEPSTSRPTGKHTAS